MACVYDYDDYDGINEYTTRKKIAETVMLCKECGKEINVGEKYTEHSYFEGTPCEDNDEDEDDYDADCEEKYIIKHATHTLCKQAIDYLHENNICVGFGDMLNVENCEGENVFDMLTKTDALFREKFANSIMARIKEEKQNERTST